MMKMELRGELQREVVTEIEEEEQQLNPIKAVIGNNFFMVFDHKNRGGVGSFTSRFEAEDHENR